MICCYLKPVMKWLVLTEQGDVDLPDSIVRGAVVPEIVDWSRSQIPLPYMLVPGAMAWDLDLNPTTNC